MKKLAFAALTAATLAGASAFAAAPANDNKANPQAISGESGSLTADLTEATHEGKDIDWLYDECSSERNVWYAWTAPKTSLVEFVITPDGFDAVISSGESGYGAEWYGDDNFNPGDGVTMYVESGKTYIIEVGGYEEENFGEFTLTWKMKDAPNGPWDIEDGILVDYLGRREDVSDVVVPDGVKEIGEDAFADWGDLEVVTFPGTVTKIQGCAFAHCHDLVTVNLNEGLVAIEDDAFRRSGLEQLRLPSTVTEITTNAFLGIDGEVTVFAPSSLKGKLQSTTLVERWMEEVDDGDGKCHEEERSITTKLTVVFGVHAETTEAVPTSAASQYDGVLSDATGKIAGTIQLKIGKANARTGISAVSGTAQVGSNRKTKFKGTFKDGALTADGMSLKLDAKGMTGTFGTYEVDGVRNIFTAKDATSKAAAAEALKKLKGAYTIGWSDAAVWTANDPFGSLTVSVANRGKVKIAGLLPNGTKVTAISTQLLAGDSVSIVPVVSTKKKVPLAFKLWFNGSEQVLDGLSYAWGDVDKVGTLEAGAKAYCPYLDAEVPVTVNGKKWVVGKTDKTVALKLTYNAKTGTFKGSFKRGKQKATVNGVVVDGVGLGSATIKKVGSVSFVIENVDD